MKRSKGLDKRRHTAPPANKIVISVIQQKGGVGKTTLSVHLAHLIADLRPKWRVMVADADPRRYLYPEIPEHFTWKKQVEGVEGVGGKNL